VKAIQNTNEYDEPAKPFELPAIADGMHSQFLESDDLSIIEDGIRTIDRTTGMLRIVQGLAILKAESLWDQSGCSSLLDYRKEASKRYDMSRASVSNLRKIAYAWSDNIKWLRKLDLSGKAAHLLYLDEAIQRYQDKRLVIEHLKADSSRDFAVWAHGESEPEEQLPDVDMTIKAGRILLDGRVMMKIGEDLPDEERDFVARTLKAAYRARIGNRLAHVVGVYDEGEARAVDNFLKKHRAAK